ncbi:MAG: hypothetical protein KatS3mg031_1266 [Chitinophagales bacterium]|nr:MAG: hypothetical protein KatS3mg031_1266 [Chitinophagales bacterium]
MKAAVIGGAGEIGSRIAQSFLTSGQPVRIVGRQRSPRLARWSNVEFIALELPASRQHLEEALAGCDAVVNCVVDKKPFESDEISIRSNVEGLCALLEAAMAQGIKKFIHLSTIAVLPPRLTRLDNLYDYSKETDWYSRVKIATEKAALEYRSRLDLCIVRPGIVYGPYLHWSRMAFFKTQQYRVIVPANPESVCHAIHVDDLVQLIRHLLHLPQKLPELMHAVNPEVITWKDFYAKHAHALGWYDNVVGELPEHTIRSYHDLQKRLQEEGPPLATRVLQKLRGMYHQLPAPLTQNRVSVKTIEVLKVLYHGLPFYTRLLLPPPKEDLLPNAFELELYSSTARFTPALTGCEQGFTYEIPFTEGVRMAAAWWNFQI